MLLSSFLASMLRWLRWGRICTKNWLHPADQGPAFLSWVVLSVKLGDPIKKEARPFSCSCPLVAFPSERWSWSMLLLRVKNVTILWCQYLQQISRTIQAKWTYQKTQSSWHKVRSGVLAASTDWLSSLSLLASSASLSLSPHHASTLSKMRNPAVHILNGTIENAIK